MRVEALKGRELRDSDRFFSEDELSKLDKASDLFNESKKSDVDRVKKRKRSQACSILREMFSSKDKPFDKLRY